jgi:hypothetical protein
VYVGTPNPYTNIFKEFTIGWIYSISISSKFEPVINIHKIIHMHSFDYFFRVGGGCCGLGAKMAQSKG